MSNGPDSSAPATNGRWTRDCGYLTFCNDGRLLLYGASAGGSFGCPVVGPGSADDCCCASSVLAAPALTPLSTPCPLPGLSPPAPVAAPSVPSALVNGRHGGGGGRTTPPEPPLGRLPPSTSSAPAGHGGRACGPSAPPPAMVRSSNPVRLRGTTRAGSPSPFPSEACLSLAWQ